MLLIKTSDAGVANTLIPALGWVDLRYLSEELIRAMVPSKKNEMPRILKFDMVA